MSRMQTPTGGSFSSKGEMLTLKDPSLFVNEDGTIPSSPYHRNGGCKSNVAGFYPESDSRKHSSNKLFRQASVDDFGSVTPRDRDSNDSMMLDNFSDADRNAIPYLVQAFQAADTECMKSHIVSLIDAFQKNIPMHSGYSTNGKFEQLDMESYLAIEDEPEGKTSRIDGGKPTKVGYLWKPGNYFHSIMKKRYYKLVKNCLYYYSDEKDQSPKGVIFLTGSLISIPEDKKDEVAGYYCFEVLHQDLLAGEHHKHEHRLLYCQSKHELDEWMKHLRHAAQVVPINEDYVLQQAIGKGRFSEVLQATHIRSGKKFAVKRINKSTIAPDEKDLLRTEIVVLKLMHHPNIIVLEGLYESKDFLYIVMELIEGGDLFSKIQNRSRFKEHEAAMVIRPLLEAVAYIHDLGIVHRDIKPENILCYYDASHNLNLKVADFGLSKIILPEDLLYTPCGTLSYVAPEVLSQQGYGKGVDIWAIGVIFYLILNGKFPFEGNTPNDVLTAQMMTPQQHSKAWNDISENAMDLLKAMLNTQPQERITARNALKHPFIISNTVPKAKPADNKTSSPAAAAQPTRSSNVDQQSLTFSGLK